MRERIHPSVSIGHIHLTVSDLDRSLGFYRDLLGFQVVSRMNDSAVFLSAGGYHHHIAINTWAGKGATPPPSGHTGLFHYAILFPNRVELARTVKRLLDAQYPLEGMADHEVSEAIYLRNPDENGIELYVDRPRETWRYTADGMVAMGAHRLDLKDLLAQAS
jgi:catechol 2,3-dioxygenase